MSGFWLPAGPLLAAAIGFALLRSGPRVAAVLGVAGTAAARVTTNRVIAWPECRASRSHTSNATRSRLAALSMSSTAISTRIALRRARTPYTPMPNSSAETTAG